MENLTNQAEIAGKIVGEIGSHKNEGENFLEFKLAVKRLSQVEDVIPVTIAESIAVKSGLDLTEGQELYLKGEFRSYNKIVGERSRLMLHFFVHEASQYDKDLDNPNSVRLLGFICKPPIFRTTPFNREICDILIAVNRPAYNKTDYIPCILWGRNARFMQDRPVGTAIDLTGRIQSREYEKRLSAERLEKRTAYEVSCQSVAIVEKFKSEQEAG